MRQNMEMSKKESVWNMISMIMFVLLLIVTGTLMKERGLDIRDAGWRELLLLTLATYRMTRLVVYDRIFKLFRDLARSVRGTGIGAALLTIFTCPWCAGVWMSLFSVVIYFLVPFGYLFIYLMSFAGIGTLIQLLANIAGLSADRKQLSVREERERKGFSHH